jgi:single-stranded DNA-binding protein ssbB
MLYWQRKGGKEMVNQIILVGRLVKTPELELTDSGKKISTITLAVPRTYKNLNGEYDTDFIDCTLWTGVAENTSEYCKTGDILGVRGRIQSRIIEKDDGTKYKKMEIIAEKVSFLSSTKDKKDNEVINNIDLEEKTEENNDEKKMKQDKKKK